ncbi:MAG: hypothetical protein Q7T61_01875 [Caulobacter sp.]|nr:hypothetical protein [Caulobacter sp.]
MNAASSTRPRLPARLILACLGLAAGIGLGFLVGRLIKTGVLAIDRLTWSDHGATVIAAIFVGLGLIVAVASVSPKLAGRLLDPDGERAATPAQASLYRMQALVTVLAGAMLGAPVIVALAFNPLPMPVASVAMLAIVAAFLLQTACNLMLWRRGDELMRRVMAETGAVCFWILQGLLFLWAAAAKLELAPAVSSWDLITVLMGFYLLVSSAMSMRRGLA